MRFVPEPTRTFVLDVGRRCNINCKFCYYHHLGDLSTQGWKGVDFVYEEIRRGIRRGNDRVEITGGEPTLFPCIEEVIYYLKKNSIETCIITNGVVSENKLNSLIDARVDEFLVSVHGTEEIHDMLTVAGARKVQCQTLKLLNENRERLSKQFRFNFVINVANQKNILEATKWMALWNPTAVNFINMNPHHGWKDSEETERVVADLRIVEPLLNESIKYLESKLIGVNVRYYPMCRIAEEFRHCICNDLHVMFDAKEWDYSVIPKTFERYREWGIDTSNNVEEKEAPCNQCELQWICGGANKYFHKASNKIYGEVLIPQSSGIEKDDFYYYRKDCSFEKEKRDN